MIYAVNKRTKEHKLANLSEYNMNMYPHSQYKIIEADADGWIEWHGGEQPLPDGHPVEIKKRKGRHSPSKADDYVWGDYLGWDRVVTYRPVLNDKPQWVPEVGARCEVTHGEAWREALYLGIDIFGNYAYQLADGEFMGEFNGTPYIQDFRPLPTEEDRAIEEMYRDAQLADCAGYRKQPTQPAADMDDPANWRAGDWIECYKSALQLTKGRRYEVLNMVGDDNPVISNDDGEREERYSAVFKHASRP